MKKLLLPISILFLSLGKINAQCEAMETFNEDFESYATFPAGSCWTTNLPSPYFFLNDAIASDKKLNFYSLYKPNDTFYLISPELTSIDGMHRMSFEGARGGNPGIVKVTIGTMSDNMDMTTFESAGVDYDFDFDLGATSEEIVFTSEPIVAITDHKYAVLRIISSNTHQNLILDNIIWEEVPCEAIVTLDEDFESFTTFPQSCWNASHPAPHFTLTGTDDKAIQFYSFSSASDDFYLVSPELTDIPLGKSIAFDAVQSGNPGTITVQAGVLSVNDDFTTFSTTGEALAIGTETNVITNEVPVVAGHQYVALKIKASNSHQALRIDHIKFVDTPSAPSSVTNHEIASLQVIPNPFTDYIHISAETKITEVEMFDFTGRTVYKNNEYKHSFEISTQELASGFYVLIVKTANAMQTFKMIK